MGDDYNQDNNYQGDNGGGGGDFGSGGGSSQNVDPAQVIDPAPIQSAEEKEKAYEKAEKKEELTEKISTLITLGIQCLQVLMACLLVVFVPQSCPESAPPVPTGCPAIVCPNPCSVSETLTNLRGIQIVALVLNFITLVVTLVYQYCVWLREDWMIMHFHFDDDKYSEDNLKKTLPLYDVIDYNFKRHNYQTLILAGVCMVLHIINIVLSAFVVFTDRYGGTHTLTTYLTYVLLVVGIFKGALMNAWQGLHGRGLSNFTLLPYEWNMIRPEHAPRGQAEDNKKAE